MMDNLDEEIEIIDIDFDEEDELTSFETVPSVEVDLLNTPEELQLEIETIEKEQPIVEQLTNKDDTETHKEEGFSHILFTAFLGGFAGGIILTIVLHII